MPHQYVELPDINWIISVMFLSTTNAKRKGFAIIVSLDKPKGMSNTNEVGNSTQQETGFFFTPTRKKLIIRNYTGIGTLDKE